MNNINNHKLLLKIFKIKIILLTIKIKKKSEW